MNKHILKNRAFLFIWIGNAISELGGAFGTFCNSILIYQLTGSPMALGSMWLLYFVPSLILQLFIGPFIDRWSRKWIMIVSQWARAVIFLLPLLFVLSGNLEPWHIFAVQLMIGFITPFYVPANYAITPTIVPKNQLESANAFIDGTVRLMTFLAPIIGGVIVEYIGVLPTLTMVCLFYTGSGMLLLYIREERLSIPIRDTWLKEFSDGITYFFKQKLIVWLGIFLSFVQFGVGVTMVITLPYITGELSGSYAAYGYFMAGFPLGYVIGSILVGKIKWKSRRIMMLGALVVGGLTFISLGLNRSIPFAIFTETVAGVAMAFFSIHNVTILQKTIPNHLIGKVFSVRMLIIRGAIPLGVLVGGILSELWGIRALYFLIGTVICSVSLLGIFLPYFRFIDSKNSLGTD